MNFKNDVNSLKPPTNIKIELVGTNLPTNKDAYFRTKQKEIVDQYVGARLFLDQTETTDWEHWFQEGENENANKAFKYMHRSYFYEASLFFYNAVVDLTWTLCYLCAEFAITDKSQRVGFEGCKPIDEAYDLLRKAENLVTSPTAETNPFEYLKQMRPEYSKAIQIIIDFWINFSSSPIRKKYNYCKHKGKPSYSEIEALKPDERLINIFLQSKETGNQEQIVSDVRDVQWIQSLEENITELKEFDEETLFPYVKSLLEELETIVNPSPLVF